MVDVEGPDGLNYNIHFRRNKEIEEILFHCTERKIEVLEGHFPWIRKALLGGYKVHLAEGWKRFSTAVRGGFFIGNTAYLHIGTPIEEKLAIGFHEIIHIIEGHEEGKDLPTEVHTTERAIEMVLKCREFLTGKRIKFRNIVRALERRLRSYQRQGV